MRCNEIIRDGVENATSSIAADALTLLAWMKKEGLAQRAAAGALVPGTEDHRVGVGLLALAEIVFGQATHADSAAFDLYDALNDAWPEHGLSIPASFHGLHSAWRSHTPFIAWPQASVVDLRCHKRVREFIGVTP